MIEEWIVNNWWLVALVIVVGMMLLGHTIGFVRITLSLTSFIITILLSSKIEPYVEKFATEVMKIQVMGGAGGKFLIFLVLFILISIIMKLILKYSKIIDKIPVLSGLNKILGSILGLIFGLVILLVVYLVFKA